MVVASLYEIANLQSLMSDLNCITMHAKIEYSVHTVSWLRMRGGPKNHAVFLKLSNLYTCWITWKALSVS